MRCRFWGGAFFLLMVLPALSAQSPPCLETVWSLHFGGGEDDIANQIIETSDGHFVVVGQSKSSDGDLSGNSGEEDFWVLKLDTLGQVVWQRNYGGPGSDKAGSVAETPAGDYLVAGSSLSVGGDVGNNYGEEDAWLVKLSPDGQILWEKNYGGSANENIEEVRVAQDGGILLIGYSESNDGDVGGNNGDFDFWMVKLDADGNLVWSHHYGGSAADWGYRVRETQSGELVVAGSTFSSNGDVSDNKGFYDFWVFKTDAGGNMLWERNFGGITEERAYALELAENEDIIVAGTSISGDGDVGGNNGGNDAWFIRLSPDGDLLWSRNYGGIQEDRSFSIAPTLDGGFVSAGISRSSNADVANNYGAKDGWIVKLDANGNLEWEKNYGGTNEDRLFEIRQTRNRGFIACGFSFSDDIDLPGNNGGRDFWVLKLSPDSVGIDLGPDTTLCLGQTLLLRTGLDDSFDFLWQDGATDSTFLVVEEGLYHVRASRNGCEVADTIFVDYVDQESVQLGADTTLCEGQSVTLSSPLDGAHYLWQNGDTSPTLTASQPGIYWLE
ncbi:MAG: hypothetical protein D6714_00520, partial [Bacteroidetes bacterium]